MSQNIWVLTIGSSDVQLKTDRFWNDWCPEIEHKFHGNIFEPTKTEQFIWGQDGEESERITYRLPARVLGLAYDALPDQVGKHLTFPLLDQFISQLKEEQVIPTTIVILLTDQEQFFSELDKKRDFCPYWQDTCWLKEVLTDCFFGNEDNGLKGVKLKWIILSPQNEESEGDKKHGLDHWDKVLSLVTNELKKFKKVNKIELKPGDRVYVSHQSGTPAISSAVQFSCLAKFEKQFQVEGKPPQQAVRFLVSNEYGSPTKPIESSEYLRGIRKQEALALLERHDYSGIKALVSHYLNSYEQILLNAAIQWNFAKFDEFVNEVGKLSSQDFQDLVQGVEDRRQHWWWTAYEAAYLGAVRLNQGNTVEALFHSFRSVEGLISEWARWKYPNHVKYEQDNYGKWAWFVKKTIHQELPNYRKDKFPRDNRLKLFSQSLYDLLQEGIPEAKTDSDMTVFLNDARDQRNELFHQLLGLTRLKVYEAWSISVAEKPHTDEEWNKVNQDWQKRLLGCLKCVSEESFVSLEEASLMVKVHQELKDAIAQL